MSQEEREILIDRIEQAFANNQYPGDEKLVPFMSENAPYADDFEEVADTYKGVKWETVSLDFIESNYNGIFYFSPEGFHYYLPAFLRAALIDTESMVYISTITVLTPRDEKGMQDYFLPRVRTLNPEQVTVIKDFLHLCIRLEPEAIELKMDRAIEFWDTL